MNRVEIGLRKRCLSSITGMLMSSSINSMSGSAASRAKASSPVVGKAEGELAIRDLTAKPLPDQRLEIGLVIDAKNFGRLRHRRVSQTDAEGSWRSCSFR
jgi:hypothetical protein